MQLESLLEDLGRVPLTEKAPIFNENPPIVGRPKDSGARPTVYGDYGGRNHHKHNPHKLHDLPVLKRVADRVLDTAKKGGGGWVELERFVQVLLGDPNIMCGTNTKGEVCLSGGSLALPCLPHLVAILHSQLRSMRP